MEKIMSGEKIIQFDLGAEIKKYFDNTSIPANNSPEFVLLCGAVCNGKTTMRKQQYSKGYVLIDAAEIFLSLSNGEYYDFASILEEPLELIGSLVARQAIRERRNIVTEIIGATKEVMFPIIDAMESISYKINLIYVECEMEESWKRNVARSNDNISAYYTETYHRRWILEAVKQEGL
jgi:hypothetical protein